MAILKTTYVSGGLYVTGSGNFISASEFRGLMVGTASWAENAVSASIADNISPEAYVQAAGLLVSGNAQINGDLKVNGNLEYIGTQDLRVKDHQIEINVDESGSAQSSANGAGVIIKGTDTNVTLIYSSSDDKLHINKTIAGTIDSASEAVHAVSASRAASAEEADKVKYALTFGSGISKSANTYDGSAAVTVSLDTASVKAVKVNSASRADSAESADTASKVANNFHMSVKHSGSAAVESDYNGSAVVSASVDFTDVEATQAAHSASIAQLRADVDAMSGGSGSIAEQINAATASLNGDASATATGTAVSGGVFVLSGVAINEAEGKLTSGSATSVEVEKAGAAAKAVAALSQSIAVTDASQSARLTALEGATGSYLAASEFNAYTQSANSRLSALETASGSAISRLDALETASESAISRLNTIESKTGSYVTSASLAEDLTADRLRLSSLEGKTGSYINNTTFQTYTASANGRLDSIEAVTASLVGGGYVETADFETYTASVAADQLAQDNRLDALETASGSAISRLDTLEAATSSYANSASVATALSASKAAQATKDEAQDNRLSALETASGSAISRLNSLEAATSSYANSASVATVTSASEAKIAALEASASAITTDYVKKAGDTMSGDLNMNTSNGIIFGDMKIVWNATDQAIEFVSVSE